MGSIGAGASNGAGTSNSVIPSHSTEDIQRYVDNFDTGMKVERLVENVYNNLPAVGEFRMMGGMTTDRGASIVNGRYLEIKNGPLLQFRKTKQGWKVKTL